MQSRATGLAVLALLWFGLAGAQEVKLPDEAPKIRGLEVGVRVGGSRQFDPRIARALIEGARSGVPVWVDAGYRVSRVVFLGGYAQLGPTIQDSSPWDTEWTLAARFVNPVDLSVRFGIEALFHLPAERQFQPWIGGGLGLEFNVYAPNDRQWVIELFNVQLGVDLLLSSRWSLGLFASCAATLGNSPQALVGSSTRPDATVQTIGGPTASGRATAGVRGTFLAF